MIPSTIRQVANDLRPTAQVLPLVRADGRRSRRETAGSTASLGQILLFTGVRYERLPEIEAEPAMPQRRRS